MNPDNEATPTKTFFIAIGDDSARSEVERRVMTEISEVSIDHATNFAQTFAQIQKAPPRVLVTDGKLPGAGIDELLQQVLSHASLGSMAVVVLTALKEDRYLDEMVSAKLQFVDPAASEESFAAALRKALKFSFEFGAAEFKLRNISAGEVLFKMGDHAGHVYLLKRGKLRVFLPDPSGSIKVLGEVSPGDFVGEMAYFNSEPRSASVDASVDCELIEIPIRNFEAVLMQKPLWCKKILQSLSQRLKEATKKK